MSGPEHAFDEALISGYIDGELTQGDTQRVRLHLESCAHCKQVADDLRQLKETTMTTPFSVPKDTQWDETPRTTASRILHNSGWLLAIAWALGVIVYAVWQIATDAEPIRLEGVLGFGAVLAFGLIVLSALADRLQTQKNDPYRKVKK